MDEIEGLTLSLELRGERRSRLLELNSIPSHMRNLELRRTAEPDYLTRKRAKTGHIALLRKIEERLHTEANAKKRPVVSNPAAHGIIEPRRPQCRHAITQRADARQHESINRADLSGCTHYLRPRTDCLKGLGHATEVTNAVINDGDDRSGSSRHVHNFKFTVLCSQLSVTAHRIYFPNGEP